MSIQQQAAALVGEMEDHVRTKGMERVEAAVALHRGRPLTATERLFVEMGIAAGSAEAMVFLQSKGMLG